MAHRVAHFGKMAVVLPSSSEIGPMSTILWVCSSVNLNNAGWLWDNAGCSGPPLHCQGLTLVLRGQRGRGREGRPCHRPPHVSPFTPNRASGCGSPPLWSCPGCTLFAFASEVLCQWAISLVWNQQIAEPMLPTHCPLNTEESGLDGGRGVLPEPPALQIHEHKLPSVEVGGCVLQRD